MSGEVRGDAPSLRESLTPELEARCLSFDPFSGDETDVSDLSDGFVKGRKDYECQHCAGPIYKGERHRAKTERNNEDHVLMTFRFCPPCCASMAVYNDFDHGTDTLNADYEDRMTLGMARREPARYASYLKNGVPGLPPALAVELATVLPGNRKDGSSQQTSTDPSQ